MEKERLRSIPTRAARIERAKARAAILLFLAAWALASGAHAHALLDHADPAVGSTVAAPPRELALWFTQSVEPAFSHVEVRDDGGHRVDAGALRRDERDARLLHVPLEAIGSGSYEVLWRVVSADTHKTEGRFRFTVVR